MKLNLMTLALATLPLAAAFTACDDVSESDRYVKMDHFEPARRVLLEDFTGQRCVNCPAAHRNIDDAHAQYGDFVIPVAIHGGSPGFEIPSTNTRVPGGGLANDEGAYYGLKHNPEARPIFCFNRTGVDYTPAEGSWQAALRTELGKPTSFDIRLSASCADSVITVTTTMLNGGDKESKLRLQLWVVEDGIVARQSGVPDDERDSYVHNHVFRAAVNGLDGEEVTLAPDRSEQKQHTIKVFNDGITVWNIDNLQIVGFLYDESGVKDVNRAEVK